jgi:hypothetical protein
LGIYLFERVPDLIHAHRMREANPLRSIASRLDYERRAAAQLATTAATQPKPLWSASVTERLAKREEEIAGWNGYRRHVLESLHDRTREQFILSPEFGRVRVPPLRSSRISLPESPLIPLPGKERQPLELPADSAGASSPPAFTATVPPAASLESLHAASELDFLHPRYFGFIADIDHVAGFVSHRFSESPTLSFSGASRWRLVRLELVSLLRHDVPVAYVSEHLPNMDELKDAPTRPLEPFEEAALAQLRTADDVIFEEVPGQVKMLGSLRAASRCVECHAVKRGELLGALTYRLVLDESASTRRQLEPPET